MSSLFIVGNGFDIAHGIPTKYSDFRRSSLRIILMHLNIVMKLYLCLIINILMKKSLLQKYY